MAERRFEKIRIWDVFCAIFCVRLPHTSHPEDGRSCGDESAPGCGGEDVSAGEFPGLVYGQIDRGGSPQIYNLIEVGVEIRIALGLILAGLDLVVGHASCSGTDYQAMFFVDDVAEGQEFVSYSSDRYMVEQDVSRCQKQPMSLLCSAEIRVSTQAASLSNEYS